MTRTTCLFARGPWLHGEVRLEGALLGGGDGGALALLLARREDAAAERVGVALGRLRLVQPRRQHRLQRDHVVVRQRQRLEPGCREGCSGVNAIQIYRARLKGGPKVA